MKKTILLLLVLTFPILIFAQIQWQENGIPLRIAQNLNSGQSLNFSDGSLFITWSETRDESRGVYAQKIDDNGNLLWGNEGLEIINVINSQRNVQALATNDNCIILVWKDWRNLDLPELRIQKIDSDGNFLWGDEGIILCANLYVNSNIDLVLDNANGIFVFWYIMYSGGGTFANHILADGSYAPGWTSSGTLIFENSIYNAIPDEDGNIIFTTVIDDELVIQKMDDNCNLLWGASGQLISNYDSYSFVGEIVPGSNNTYYIVWRDRRVSDGIYCNLIDQNGNKIWNEDTELVTDYYYHRFSINTSDEELIVCWLKENDIYQVIAQKIDNTGTKQWGDDGVIVSGDEDSHVQGIVSDENGSCWITWMSGVDLNKVYVQHLDSFGNKLLEENGVNVCSYESYQFYPSITTAPDNEYFITWSDRREKRTGFYCQIVDNDGNLVLNQEGIKIVDGISEDILDLEVVANSNGSYYFWKDNRSCGHNEIYLQKVDSAGNILLQENGESIMPNFNGYVRNYDYQFNDNTNLLNIVWEDSENSQITLQAIDDFGNLVWSESGITLNSSYLYDSDPMISQKDEYTYVGWTGTNTFYNDKHVIAQKIDQNGNFLWGTEGIVLNSIVQNDFISTMTGRCYFWLSYDDSEYSLYAELLDENGNPVPGWNANGLLISNLSGQIFSNTINNQAFETDSGYLIYWIDESILKGQLISEDGSILWQEGGFPIINSGHDLMNMKATSDEDQQVTYITWIDTYPAFNSFIYAQKVDIDGNELWNDNGISISEGLNPDIARIGDYILIIWEDETDDYTYDIKGQLLNQAGEEQWEQGGISLCDAPHDQLGPKVEVFDDNHFVICWRDNRAGQYGENEVLCTSIYTQKIYVGPTYTPDEILNAITAELHQNFPNPFNPSTTISFNVTQSSAFATIEIYNLKGQKVKTLPVNPSTDQPINSVTWNGTDNNNKPVSSGIYFYKLKAGKLEKTKKMLLLK